MKDLPIKIETFEGPFSVLYNLIEKNKIDIYDIPISLLTEQFLQYIEDNNVINMEYISDFILMASTLLYIKSKMLLPKDENENEDEDKEDPREQLVKSLIEYRKYKKIAEIFSDKINTIEQRVFKDIDESVMEVIKEQLPLKPQDILNDVSLEMLYSAFKEVLKRKELKTDKIRSKFNSVTKKLFNVSDKIEYISNLMKISDKISFDDIFRDSSCKSEVVVTFLAILELIKIKNLKVVQSNNFNEIIITKGGL